MSGSSRSWGCAPQAHQYFRSILWGSLNYTPISEISFNTKVSELDFGDTGSRNLSYENMLNANKENFYIDWQVQSFYTYEQEQLKYGKFRLVGFAKISELYADASYDTSSSPITSAKTAAHDGTGKCLSAYLPIRTTEAKIAAQTLTCYPAWADSEYIDTWAYLWYANSIETNRTFDVSDITGSSEILDSSEKAVRSEWMLSVTYNACAFMQEDSMSSINSSVNDIAGTDSSPWHSTVEAGVTHQCIPYSAHYTLNRHTADSVTYITSTDITVASSKYVATGSVATITIPISSSRNESLYYYSSRDYITPNPIYPTKSVVSRKLGVYDNMPINKGGSQISGQRIAFTVSGFAGLISRPCIYSPLSGKSSSPSSAPSDDDYSNKKFYAYLTSLSLGTDENGDYYFSLTSGETTSNGTLYYSPTSSSVSYDFASNFSSSDKDITLIYVPTVDGSPYYASAQRMNITVTLSVNAETWVEGSSVNVTVDMEISSNNSDPKISFSLSSTDNGESYSISYTTYSAVDEYYEGVLASCEDDLPMSFANNWDTSNRLLRNIVYNSIDETCCWQDETYRTSRDGWSSQAAQWGNGQLATHTLDRYHLRTFPSSSCRLSYKSLSHNVLVLGLNGSDACEFIPIPGTTSYYNKNESCTVYAPCSESLIERAIKYQITKDQILNATVPIIEVYRDSLDSTRLYGQSWISCGEAVDIQSLDNDAEVVMSCTEGDSYYQSWDCYHCGPYSSDSVNSVIDTFKLPLESWINLHGRYDVYRSVDNLSGVDIDDFFKVNEVYSQHNNLITYSYHSSTQSDSVDEFPTSIVWSSAMSYGVDNDPWSEIYLTNMCYLDGNCGAVNSLNLFNNNLYAFQDRGISVIKYNENVQLESSATASISLGNSGAVDGYDLIAKDIGVTDFNKVYITHENMYFADHNRQAIFGIGQKGINNLSDLGGFHSFFQEYDSFSDSWNPVENKGLKLLYDAENTELMIQMEDETLTYNEQLNKFCSFFDYKDYSSLTYINGYNIATYIPQVEEESSTTSTSSSSTTETTTEESTDGVIVISRSNQYTYDEYSSDGSNISSTFQAYDYALSAVTTTTTSDNGTVITTVTKQTSYNFSGQTLDFEFKAPNSTVWPVYMYIVECNNGLTNENYAAIINKDSGYTSYGKTLASHTAGSTAGSDNLWDGSITTSGNYEGIALIIWNKSASSQTLVLAGAITTTTTTKTITTTTTTSLVDGNVSELYTLRTGTYNKFFDTNYDYSLTLLPNADPTKDKTWTNIDMRSDKYDEDNSLVRKTFDTIQVWNEYQDSGTKKLTELQPVFSPLKEKFRIWRVQLPRDSEKKFDRIRNPWCYIKLSSDTADNNDNCKFVLHDINVWYV